MEVDRDRSLRKRTSKVGGSMKVVGEGWSDVECDAKKFGRGYRADGIAVWCANQGGIGSSAGTRVLISCQHSSLFSIDCCSS